MAELYLASLAGAGGFRKFVALKRVLPSIAEDQSFIQMFLDEARITAALSHASIAQVYELTEDPQSHEPVLAMEFVAGQNLEQLINRARKRKLAIPMEFSLRVAHDVLMGLHSAHAFVEPATGTPMPVIHRDINPRNVMVTYTGGTKIIDFGIAKARGRLNQTQVGYVKGTIQYMSPEQITAKEVTGRTDLFAASLVFYELLSGKRVFGDEGSDAATMSRIVSGELTHLVRAAPSLPEAVADAVMQGLEKDPARRWRTGREYARALERAAPETWDDPQMGEFMARLFDDKIAVTRGLLSSSTQANVQDLRLMTMMGEEDNKAPFEDVPTAPGRAAVKAEPAATDRTEQALEPVAAEPVRAQRPATSDATAAVLPPALARSADTGRAGRPATSDATRAVLPPTPPKTSDSGRAARPATSDATAAVLPAAGPWHEADETRTSLPPTPGRKRTSDAEPSTETPPPPRKRAADEELITETPPPPRKRTQEATPARSRSRVETPAAKPKRTPVGLYGLAVVLALVFLAAALWLLLGGPGEPERGTTPPPKTQPRPPRAP